MRPADTTAFDVALDHLVPGEMRLGRSTVPENALMDDEAHARVCRRIHDRFTLLEHGDRVAGQQEQSINALQGRRTSSCVIEVEIDGSFGVALPRFHLFVVSSGTHDLDVRRAIRGNRSEYAACL